MDPTVPRSAPGKRHDWLTTDLLPDCAGYDSATQAAKGARIPARKPGFSTFKRECGRETDSPLEGDGFELPVPGCWGPIRFAADSLPQGTGPARCVSRACFPVPRFSLQRMRW